MSPPADLDGLSHADLKSLVLKLFEEMAELRRTVAAQRDEIARLKGGPGRPNIKPSGMDKATEPKPQSRAGGQPRPKGSKTSKLSIDEERTIRVPSPPDGSRFKGYAVRRCPNSSSSVAPPPNSPDFCPYYVFCCFTSQVRVATRSLWY